MRKPKKYIRRAFLNKLGHHGLAAALARVNSGGSKDYAWVEAELILSDCTRQITLDFSVYINSGSSAADIENVQHKLDALITTVSDFRDAFDIHLEHALGIGEDS